MQMVGNDENWTWEDEKRFIKIINAALATFLKLESLKNRRVDLATQVVNNRRELTFQNWRLIYDDAMGTFIFIFYVNINIK